MALQNRVDPFGEIHATPERGTLLGNRGGCFHDDQQRLTKARWASRQWIACLLEFKGRHREVMQPHRYTELFFLDEATALAAGHRPCFECRREDANRFFAALRAGVPGLVSPGERLRVEVVDRRLHDERVAPGTRAKRTVEVSLSEVPDGAMVALPGEPGTAFLVWQTGLLSWSFARYGPPRGTAGMGTVTLLTPPTIVAALRAGYVPAVHESAAAASDQLPR